MTARTTKPITAVDIPDDVLEVPELSDSDYLHLRYRGEIIKLPLLENIRVEAIESVSLFAKNPDEINAENVLDFMRVAIPEISEATKTMTVKQLLWVFRQLEDASAVGLGELQASATT